MLHKEHRDLVQLCVTALQAAHTQNVIQITGEYFEMDDAGQPCAFCAVGYIYFTQGITPDMLPNIFGEIIETQLDSLHIVVDADVLSLHQLIVHLNDDKEMSFEQIASRLEVLFGLRSS